MDPETKQKLENIERLAEENNQMLHKVRNVQKREVFFRVLRYLIIIAIAFGLFYYLEPYLNKVMNLFTSIAGIEKNLDSSSIQNLFKNFAN